MSSSVQATMGRACKLNGCTVASGFPSQWKLWRIACRSLTEVSMRSAGGGPNWCTWHRCYTAFSRSVRHWPLDSCAAPRRRARADGSQTAAEEFSAFSSGWKPLIDEGRSQRGMASLLGRVRADTSTETRQTTNTTVKEISGRPVSAEIDGEEHLNSPSVVHTFLSSTV